MDIIRNVLYDIYRDKDRNDMLIPKLKQEFTVELKLKTGLKQHCSSESFLLARPSWQLQPNLE